MRTATKSLQMNWFSFDLLGKSHWTVWVLLQWVQQHNSTCAFLADVGQVVVAGHIVPLAVLVGNGHYAVLPTCEEVIWLALPPVLIYLKNNRIQQKLLCEQWVLYESSGILFLFSLNNNNNNNNNNNLNLYSAFHNLKVALQRNIQGQDIKHKT